MPPEGGSEPRRRGSNATRRGVGAPATGVDVPVEGWEAPLAGVEGHSRGVEGPLAEVECEANNSYTAARGLDVTAICPTVLQTYNHPPRVNIQPYLHLHTAQVHYSSR